MVYSFDEIGRLTVPDEVMEQLKMKKGEGQFEVRANVERSCLTLRPTKHEQQHYISGAEIRAKVEEMEKLPIEERVFIRPLDHSNRLVLPLSLYRIFHWTQETKLGMSVVDDTICLFEI